MVAEPSSVSPLGQPGPLRLDRHLTNTLSNRVEKRRCVAAANTPQTCCGGVPAAGNGGVALGPRRRVDYRAPSRARTGRVGTSREPRMSEAAAVPAKHLSRGIVLIVLAFFCLALISAFAKAAGSDVSSGVIVFFQYAISLVVLMPWFVRVGLRNLR